MRHSFLPVQFLAFSLVLLLGSTDRVVGVELDDEAALYSSTEQAGEDVDNEFTVIATAKTQEAANGLERWHPFHHQNSTNSNSTSGHNGTACHSATSCETCTAYHTCHWCNHDTACHAIGSYHGCLVGSTCDTPKPKPDKNETDPSGCNTHMDCSSCALSSRFCHWCASDNACHAVGSIHGCVSGVDCYDNTRCRRVEPEPMKDKFTSFAQTGALPLLVVGSVAALILCCATTCCCVAGGVKGAYDDLLDAAPPPPPPLPDDGEEPSVAQTPPRSNRSSRRRRDAQATAEVPVVEDSGGAAVPVEAGPVEISEVDTETEDGGGGDDETIQEMQSLLEQDEEAGADDFVLMGNDNDGDEDEVSTEAITTVARRRRPRAMSRLYNACVCCYLVTVALVVLSSFATLRYYPKIPVYNICNDAVAWKSLVDSMTAMKATAEFELLASISNPNHFDVALDMGKGTFYHKQALVGTYEIPPVTVAAMAITDILIVASFSPEKWHALSIATEYYRGKLVLHVDVSVTIRVPALLDYTFSADLKDLVVHVNEINDRSLCACPTWSDGSNNTNTLLLPDVPHWVE